MQLVRGRLGMLFRSLAILGFFVLGSLWVALTGFKSAPVILADEWIYRSQIAFMNPSDFSIPNYLYSWIYQISDLFETFYRGTQILNLLFFIGFSLVVYLFARLFADFWPSILLAFATLISPLGLFVGLQMPETPYFFFISLAIYCVVRSLFMTYDLARSRVLFIAGIIVLLAASFIKPHAVFFLFAVLVLTVFSEKPLGLSRPLTLCLMFGLGATWIGLKLGIGYLVGGPKGFAIFGEGYERSLIEQLFGEGVPQVELALSQASAPIAPAVQLNWLPLAVNFLLFLIVLGIIWFLAKETIDRAAFAPIQFVLLLTVIVSLIIMLFQIFITRSGDIHTDRFLGRHFEFLVPLLIAALFSRKSNVHRIGTKQVIAISVMAIALLVFPLAPYVPNLSDSSLLYGFTGNRWLFVVGLVALAFVVISRAKVVWIASTSLILSAVLAGVTQPLLAFRNSEQPVEKIVSSYRELSPESEIANIYSFRKQDAAAFLFLLNRDLGDYNIITKEAPLLDLSKIDRSKQTLVIGNIEVANGGEFVMLDFGYGRLFPSMNEKIPGQRTYQEQFEIESAAPEPTQNAYGLVLRKDSTLVLQRTFQPGEKIKIALVGHDERYGGETVVFSLGGEKLALQIPQFSQLQEFYLQFPNGTASNELSLNLEGQEIEFTLAQVAWHQGN